MNCTAGVARNSWSFSMIATRDALKQDALRLLREIEQAPISWHGQSIPDQCLRRLRSPSTGRRLAGAAGRWHPLGRRRAVSGQARRPTPRRAGRGDRKRSAALKGHRPIDMAQLQDWQRQGYVEVQILEIGANCAARDAARCHSGLLSRIARKEGCGQRKRPGDQILLVYFGAVFPDVGLLH